MDKLQLAGRCKDLTLRCWHLCGALPNPAPGRNVSSQISRSASSITAKMWSKVKAVLRTLQARGPLALRRAIALESVTPTDTAAWFRSRGYAPRPVESI
jgi:hypothetical protein